MPATESSPRVLLVGEPDSTPTILSPLQEAGYSVTSMDNVQSVFERHPLALWDLVLIDSAEPSATLEEMRSIWHPKPSAPVIFISRQCDRKFRAEARQWGVRQCIQKPLEPARLVRVVTTILCSDAGVPETNKPFWAEQMVTATTAKNEFAKLLQDVEKGDRVVVTKHQKLSAVVVPFDEYQATQEQAQRALEELGREFDQLLARMQTPESQAAVDALFLATPEELGRAAVKAARCRE